jgi:hypothetical protein
MTDEDKEFDIAEWAAQTDDAYRAIGRYVVRFSELVSEMRDMVCQYVANGVADMHISQLLLGEAGTQHIANAFFATCRTVGELDGDKEAVWRELRKQVDETIRMRNDIAHGEWRIGHRDELDGEIVTLPPHLVRIIPLRGEGPYKQRDLSVDDIDSLSDDMDALLTRIHDFGRLALKRPGRRAG